MPEDGLPYIGRLRPVSDRVLVATGMRKWGLAMGAAAGAILADQCSAASNAGPTTFDPWRLPPLRSAGSAAPSTAPNRPPLLSLTALRSAAGGAAELAPGEGRVVGDGLAPEGGLPRRRRVLHALSARCTHLGLHRALERGRAHLGLPLPRVALRRRSGEVLNGPRRQAAVARGLPADG